MSRIAFETISADTCLWSLCMVNQKWSSCVYKRRATCTKQRS